MDSAPAPTALPWPILSRYQELDRIAMPIGGIGTGTVSLGGRGDLRDWEIMNRPAKGYVPQGEARPSAVIWWGNPASGVDADDPSGARLLEGPVPVDHYEGSRGAIGANHGLPRFRDACFETAYPFAQVRLDDDAVPLQVRLEAFNPLVPGDAEASSLPIAQLRYVVTNTSDQTRPVAVCVSLPNFIGDAGSPELVNCCATAPDAGCCNRNHMRVGDGRHGIVFESQSEDRLAEAWGTMALTVAEGAGEITHRTGWQSGGWSRPLLDFWQDFTADGRLSERATASGKPMASLAVRRELAPGESVAFTFMLSWHFPNRLGWQRQSERIGNYYTTRHVDAWAVAAHAAHVLPDLEVRSRRFVEDLLSSDHPAVFKEAALANLSTLRSQTCFRDEDGWLYGWEGIDDRRGCCPGSCTHVWNYELATGQLFPDLARRMREVEFLYCTDDEGRMNFRVKLPLAANADIPPEERQAAADGQLGCIVRAYREWRAAGDDDWLRTCWPAIKRALAFCWITGGWDADADGVMEGCQHNTMDVEYVGPNPQMQSWYLAALQAAAEMAEHLGDADFAALCRERCAVGQTFMQDTLFNGDYYEHHIQPMEPSAIAPGLTIGMADMDPREPQLQLGRGCLIDQLVGEAMGRACGLGPFLDSQQVVSTLRSILKHNRRCGFHDHFNPMRSYALGDEEALLMCSYPRGEMPERPFPYFAEVMTGFEYVVALQLTQEGIMDEAERVVAAIRHRYDGKKRNPFDEAECGHHYARAMASWGLINAWSGFDYDARTRRVIVADREGSSLWTYGGAWGTVQRIRVDGDLQVTVAVSEGQLPYEHIMVQD